MMNIGFRILPSPKRAPKELLKKFLSIAAAHLSDNMNRLHSVDAAIRPYHKSGRLVGCAYTVKVPPGDNLMVHKAIDHAAPGDVIVVDAGGVLQQAILGEIMSAHARKRGVAGFVIDGAIRDAGEIAASPYPIYARGVTHRGPYKNGPGEINVPVSIGGLVVNPGDIVVGDEDGLVTVPQELALQLIDAANALRRKEETQLKEIAAGKWDRKWVDKTLREKGCDF